MIKTIHLKIVIKVGSTQSNISQITFLNIKKKLNAKMKTNNIQFIQLHYIHIGH